MTRPSSESLTEREAQIMDVVWRLGEATADQVRKRCPVPRTTRPCGILMRVMETKGYLKHQARGKAYIYRAAVARKNAATRPTSGDQPVLRRVGRRSCTTPDRRRAPVIHTTR